MQSGYNLEMDAVSLIVLCPMLIRCMRARTSVLLCRTLLSAIGYFAADLVWAVANEFQTPAALAAGNAACVLFFSFSAVMCAAWLLYSEDTLSAPARWQRGLRTALSLLVGLQVLLAAASPWTGWLFSIDAMNIYHRGPLHTVQYCLNMGLMMFAFFRSLHYALHGTDDEKQACARRQLLPCALPLLDGVTRLVNISVSLLWLGILLALMIAVNQSEPLSMLKKGRFMRRRVIKRVDILFSVLLCASITVLLVTSANPMPSSAWREALSGTYRTGDGRTGTLEEGFPADARELEIHGAFANPIPEGQTFFLYVLRLDVRLWVGTQELVPRRQDAPKPAEYWLCYDSPGIGAGAPVTLRLTVLGENSQPLGMERLVSQIWVGERHDMLLRGVRECSTRILIALCIFMVGIMLMVSGFRTDKYERQSLTGNFTVCGLLLTVGAVCTAIDYRYILFLFEDAYLVSLVDAFSQMLICLLLMIYIRSFLNAENLYLSLTLFIDLWFGIMILAILLEMLGTFSFEQSIDALLPFGTLLLLSSVASILPEWRKDRTIRYLLLSLVLLSLCTLVEIAKRAATGMYWISVFQIGLFGFALIQLYVMRLNIRKRFESEQRAGRLEKELNESKVAIVLSQIQPHFLFNALNTIGYLCGDEHELARQTIDRFAKYLRGNLDSLSQNAPIPFERELEHLDNYLCIEKLRFGQRLNIVYDLQTMDFSVPALTLQPLVENAIRYGVTQRKEGGTVKVSTRLEGSDVILTVADDGVGFDPMAVQHDGRSHVGLDNTRQRLNTMCGGSMALHSQTGVGTEVEIRIPTGREDCE